MKRIILSAIILVLMGGCSGNVAEQEQEQEQEVVQEVEQLTQDELQAEQKQEELNEMYSLFKDCKYKLINIEQTTTSNVRKYFNGTYMDLGEQTHYVVVLQFDGTRNDWATNWIGNRNNSNLYHETTWIYLYDDEYMETGDWADMFNNIMGMHSLTDVSGLYNKPSMEIMVIDSNGELIYNVLNGDWNELIESIKSWATQEQLNDMARSQLNARWNRDWKEFVLNK